MFDLSIFVQHFGQCQLSLNVLYNKITLLIYLFACLPGAFGVACHVEAVLMVLLCGSCELKAAKKSMMWLTVSFWETVVSYIGTSSDVFSCIHHLCWMSFLLLDPLNDLLVSQACFSHPSNSCCLCCWHFFGILEPVLEVWLHNIKIDMNAGLVGAGTVFLPLSF